jgi:hypothetical protein
MEVDVGKKWEWRRDGKAGLRCDCKITRGSRSMRARTADRWSKDGERTRARWWGPGVQRRGGGLEIRAYWGFQALGPDVLNKPAGSMDILMGSQWRGCGVCVGSLY